MTTEGHTLMLRYKEARMMRRYLVFEFWLYVALALTIMVIAEWFDGEGWDGTYVLVVAVFLFLALLSALTHHKEVRTMEGLQQELARLAIRRRAAVEEQLRITRDKQKDRGSHGPPAA